MSRTYRYKGEKTRRKSSSYEKKCANRRVRYAARHLRCFADDEMAYVGRRPGDYVHAYEMGRDYTFLWCEFMTVHDFWVEEMTVTPLVAQNYPRLAYYLGRKILVIVERCFSFDKSLPEGSRSAVYIRKAPHEA